MDPPTGSRPRPPRPGRLVSGGVVSPALRARVRGLAVPVALAFGRLGLTPNALTVLGFAIAVIAAIAAAQGAWIVAGLLVIFGGVFDLFDGALARATNKVSRLGAFLDSVFDRAGEAVLYLGIATGFLIAGHERVVLLSATAMASSFMVSYTRAKSESLGFTPGTGMANVGLAPREVRLVILTLGLLLGAAVDAEPVLSVTLALITTLATITTVQRIVHVTRQTPPELSQRSHHRRRPAPVSTNGSTNGANGAGANGHKPGRKIRVAIVGVGNCASSLVQGRYYYENAKPEDKVPGLMHVELGGYHVRDIEFVAAFDIDKNKVGKDLSEAIYQKPNNTYVFQQVPKLDVKVERGMVHDGLGKYLSQIIEKAPGETADVVGILRERQVDVVVSYLPVGSEEATKWYVEQALKAGVGFVNAIPVFIGREPYWQRRFAEEGLPVIGDDIKSQVGATISHRVLTRLFMDRGVRLDRTYQLNFGGNTDFLNMLERERLESKKISKTNAVTSMLDYEMEPDNVHVGPSDHVPWLEDRKWCYIRMEGTTFGDVPLNAELKLEVWDSPNSAGVITDAIRCLKLGLDRGLKGTLVAPSSYFMKSPPIQIHDDISHNRLEAFIRGEDNETLVGTENLTKAQLRKLASTAPVASAAVKKAAAAAR